MGYKRELLAKILSGQLSPDAIKIPGRVSPRRLLQILEEGQELDTEKEYTIHTPDKGAIVVKWRDAAALFEQYEETALKPGEQPARFVVVRVEGPMEND